MQAARETPMATIKITIELEKYRHRGPEFVATLPDGTRTRATSTPFCHAAREVLRLNLAMRDDTLEMYREGILCLSSSVGTAAGLTVQEGQTVRPRFAAWQPWVDPD
jgi:hypothetical protein